MLDEKGRSVLAIMGTFIAVLLVFLQLGFYFSVPKGGWQFYNRMRFDLMLTSSAYVSQGRSDAFPRRRIYQAMGVPEVATVAAVYQASADWISEQGRRARTVFVMGFDPDKPVFDVPEIIAAHDLLRERDTILVDSSSRPDLGPFYVGRAVEINRRSVTIGGVYDLGLGFLGLAVTVLSDQNFIRLFPDRGLETVNLGLVTLKPGADPELVAAKMRGLIPTDTQVLTRDQLADRESAFWSYQTSAGLVFGFGVIVAFVVGLVILNQTLSSEISRNLPEYATLKAMGYTDRDIAGIVVSLALTIAAIAYLFAGLAAVAIYAIVRQMTPMPIEMTGTRAGGVLVLVATMSVASTLFALRSLRRADPVDLL
ncbi:MAG TPA: FtsX-like permease family protein [Stellaceae bacterium]|nr:FtsX-like permease family protein [Stellaceae bacterium]